MMGRRGRQSGPSKRLVIAIIPIRILFLTVSSLFSYDGRRRCTTHLPSFPLPSLEPVCINHLSLLVPSPLAIKPTSLRGRHPKTKMLTAVPKLLLLSTVAIALSSVFQGVAGDLHGSPRRRHAGISSIELKPDQNGTLFRRGETFENARYTMYYQYGNPGSCGQYHSDNDFVSPPFLQAVIPHILIYDALSRLSL